MVVSENEVYQIIKKSCISENIYEDRAEDIGKAISFLHTNYINAVSYTHLTLPTTPYV